jgi:hypothetical protein
MLPWCWGKGSTEDKAWENAIIRLRAEVDAKRKLESPHA